MPNDVLCKLLVALAAISALSRGAKAETFSADLTLAHSSGLFGEYLTAPFDFGVRFADIQSARLELDIPGGYMGTAISTGISSYFRSLFIHVHDQADPPPSEFPSHYLGTSAMDVPPSNTAEFEFRRMSITFGEQTAYADWPTFLLTGAGAVSLIDVNISSYHPLPDGENATSTVSWLPPPRIESARLIIDATPIPEPSAGALGVWATLALGRFNRRSRIQSAR
jgi:hypothetical protein